MTEKEKEEEVEKLEYSIGLMYEKMDDYKHLMLECKGTVRVLQQRVDDIKKK